ncbi:hypothetical protein CLOSCI_02227 [[Clostridium] scindens ATCC 35704]|nr:hypothetical protein CLOSCI_02227 [[Clostridium] scindens ATCC 35704]
MGKYFASLFGEILYFFSYNISLSFTFSLRPIVSYFIEKKIICQSSSKEHLIYVI